MTRYEYNSIKVQIEVPSCENGKLENNFLMIKIFSVHKLWDTKTIKYNLTV